MRCSYTSLCTFLFALCSTRPCYRNSNSIPLYTHFHCVPCRTSMCSVRPSLCRSLFGSCSFLFLFLLGKKKSGLSLLCLTRNRNRPYSLNNCFPLLQNKKASSLYSPHNCGSGKLDPRHQLILHKPRQARTNGGGRCSHRKGGRRSRTDHRSKRCRQNVVRDYFSKIIAQNKSYLSKVDTLNYEGLYTPQSYLDPSEAKQIISQLGATVEIEQSQEHASDSIVEQYRTRINSLDWSEDYKRKFLQGFDEAYQKKLALRTPMLNSEVAWLNCVRDLYLFVLDNQQYFRRSGDNVAIVNTGVRNEFNAKIREANKLLQQYQTSKKLYEQSENESLNKLGVSAHDFGTTK